jgi:hypothetical protein
MRDIEHIGQISDEIRAVVESEWPAGAQAAAKRARVRLADQARCRDHDPRDERSYARIQQDFTQGMAIVGSPVAG